MIGLNSLNNIYFWTSIEEKTNFDIQSLLIFNS